MQDLITSYLFKNKSCPLPAIGSLQLIDQNATALYADKRMEAPVPVIKLSDKEIPSADFIHFIAQRKNIEPEEAGGLLTDFCNQLQNLDAYGECNLMHTGKFYVNADGNLVFKAVQLPTAFLPSVNAERVIHPSVSHSMTVGDKETTSAEMAAFYTEADNLTRDKWWVWAIVLFVAGIVTIAFYMVDTNYPAMFGNAQKITAAPATITYRLAE